MKKKLNEEAPVFKDWKESIHPKYLIITLNENIDPKYNDKKIKLERKSIRGGQKSYQIFRKLFESNRVPVLNKLIREMVSNLETRKRTINETKVTVGRIPAINLILHLDATFDKVSKEVNFSVTNQSGKAVTYTIPGVESQDKVQQIISGLEASIANASKAYSKQLEAIIAKYQK